MFVSHIVLACVLVSAGAATAQQTGPYPITETIALPGVQGGFDHLAYDERNGELFIAASDNGTVEVVDLRHGRRVKSIAGFHSPHAISVRPAQDRLFVTDSGPNSSAFIDERTLTKANAISLAPGANCILPTSDGTKLYVTAGGDRVGETDSALQLVDANSGTVEETARVAALHLQPMALDAPAHRLFVNLADQDRIGIFDPVTLQPTGSFPSPRGHKNSPTAYDKERDTLFVIASKPGILMVLNPSTGALIDSIETPPNPDDLGMDAAEQRVFVPGDGAVAVYQIGADSHIRLLQRIVTGDGGRTGIFIAPLHAFAVVVPATATQPAQLLLLQDGTVNGK